ncbi:MAG: Caspase domain [Acidobacteriota bacterium]|jgi:hypothetical protein|nr:Caspase domain [Acidobacteriota bacterium]
MKTSKLLWFAVLPLAALTLSVSQCESTQHRGVKLPLTETVPPKPARFDPKQSVAVFVGIRRFTTDPRVADVPYAVDDAVDLAYTLAIERNADLVAPGNVVLALSGEPYKMESKERLKALREEGATVVPADRDSLSESLQTQARQVGRDGIFIASFATHGFSSDGVPYVLASTSLLNSPATSLSTASVLETIGTSAAARSLVFIDACRQRIQTRTRATPLNLPTGAPLITGLKRFTGQVVLYAAAAGNYAYDDDVARNGVFTAAILEGLRCNVAPNSRGFMTVEMLAAHANETVRKWLRRRGHPVASAIQLSTDGDTKSMPVATCPGTTPDRPESVRVDGSTMTVYGLDGVKLWHREIAGGIVQKEVADLDEKEGKEVIVATGNSITVFRPSGAQWWSTDPTRPNLLVKNFFVADITTRKKRIVVLSNGADGGEPSYLSVFQPGGRQEGGYPDSSHLRRVTVAAQTARHKRMLVVAGDHNVFLLDPKNVSRPVWYGTVTPRSVTIERVDVTDYGNDGIRDLAVHTSAGHTLHLDFQGKLLGKPIGDAQFQLLARK